MALEIAHVLGFTWRFDIYVLRFIDVSQYQPNESGNAIKLEFIDNKLNYITEDPYFIDLVIKLCVMEQSYGAHRALNWTISEKLKQTFFPGILCIQILI